MQGVEAAQLPLGRQTGRPLDQILVDLDDAKRWPLTPKGLGWNPSSCQTNGAGRLHKADTTDKPAVGTLHHLANQVTARLCDIPA